MRVHIIYMISHLPRAIPAKNPPTCAKLSIHGRVPTPRYRISAKSEQPTVIGLFCSTYGNGTKHMICFICCVLHLVQVKWFVNTHLPLMKYGNEIDPQKSVNRGARPDRDLDHTTHTLHTLSTLHIFKWRGWMRWTCTQNGHKHNTTHTSYHTHIIPHTHHTTHTSYAPSPKIP